MRVQPLYAKLSDRFRRYTSAQSGSVAPVFALAILPIVGLTGAAVDYSHANAVRTAMIAAADATALNLMKSAPTLTTTQINQEATDSFHALFARADAQAIQVSAQYSPEAKSMTVAVTGSMKTDFMSLMGFSQVSIGARAVAISMGEGTACVLALNRNANGSITVQGSTAADLPGCSMYSNSSSSSAVAVGGSAKVSALVVGAVGGVSGSAAITTTKGVLSGLSPITDPYAKTAVPFFSGCLEHNFTTKTQVTLSPGVYCGGMKLNAGADVTLSPGIYYIDQGDLTVTGGAKLHGTGVTIIFTSSTMKNWPTASISGGAIINLKPPTDGPTAGLVMYADRNTPVGTSFKFNGGASQYLGGAIYLPTGDVVFDGGAGTSASCTKLIADTITFTGSAKLAIDCSGYATKAFGPAGVRLAS